MITKNYVTFFKGLEKNNNKEWFHANKSTYENEIKKPFLELLESLIPAIKELEAEISLNPKDALFRVNRDIRFSKDKTPYNTMMKAGFAPGGKKSVLPGYYLGIDAEKIHVGGGLFNLKGPELKNVRTLIAESPDEFIKIVDSKSFLNSFGKLKGEQAKRLDKSFEAILKKTSYIANKQFYAMQDIPLTNYLNSDKLPQLILNSFNEISKLNNYLKKAFQ